MDVSFKPVDVTYLLPETGDARISFGNLELISSELKPVRVEVVHHAILVHFENGTSYLATGLRAGSEELQVYLNEHGLTLSWPNPHAAQ